LNSALCSQPVTWSRIVEKWFYHCDEKMSTKYLKINSAVSEFQFRSNAIMTRLVTITTCCVWRTPTRARTTCRAVVVGVHCNLAARRRLP